MTIKALREIILDTELTGGGINRSFYAIDAVLDVPADREAQLIRDGEAVASTEVPTPPYRTQFLVDYDFTEEPEELPADANGILSNDGSGNLSWLPYQQVGGFLMPGSPGVSQIIRTPVANQPDRFVHSDGFGNITRWLGGTLGFNRLEHNYSDDTLKLFDEYNNERSSIDLSKYSFQNRIVRGSLNGATLVLEDNATGTSNVSIGLGGLKAVVTDNGDGTYLHSILGDDVLIDTRANSSSTSPASTSGQGEIGTSSKSAREDHRHAAQRPSADADNSVVVGSDGLHYFSEYVTSLSYDGSATLSYEDENGDTHQMDISGVVPLSTMPALMSAVAGSAGASTAVAREDHQHPHQAPSADSNNSISVGVDGLHFFKETIQTATSSEVAALSMSDEVLIEVASGQVRQVRISDLLGMIGTPTITFDTTSRILNFTDHKGNLTVLDLT